MRAALALVLVACASKPTVTPAAPVDLPATPPPEEARAMEVTPLPRTLVSGDHHAIGVRPGPCRIGEPCVLEIVVDTEAGYQFNSEYPTKLAFEPTNQAVLERAVFTRALGDVTAPTPAQGIIKVTLVPKREATTLRAKLKFCVNDKDTCTVVPTDLAIPVSATPPPTGITVACDLGPTRTVFQKWNGSCQEGEHHEPFAALIPARDLPVESCAKQNLIGDRIADGTAKECKQSGTDLHAAPGDYWLLVNQGGACNTGILRRVAIGPKTTPIGSRIDVSHRDVVDDFGCTD
jgi:hypothetical protein